MNKFLFILRCYSGFEKSLIKKEWSPSGATTIAKTIEYIQNDKSSNLIIVSNSFNSKLDSIRNSKLYLKKLNMPVHFIMGKLLFLSDSDALISKGLVTLISSIYSNETAEEIANSDIDLMEEFELGVILSPARRNGAYSMLKTIKEYAKKLL